MKQKNKNFEITVPLCTYAKKVLVKSFGESFEKELLTKFFFMAAGNLYAPMFQVHKDLNRGMKLHNTSNNYLPISFVDIKTNLPDYTIRLISLYKKDDIAYSLGTLFNQEARAILNSIVEFYSEQETTKTKACQKVFEYFGIEEDELSFRKYVGKHYSK